MPLKVEHKVLATNDATYVIWRESTRPHEGYRAFRDSWQPGESSVCVYVSDAFSAEEAFNVGLKYIMKDYVAQYEDQFEHMKQSFAQKLSMFLSFSLSEKEQFWGHILEKHNLKPKPSPNRIIKTSYWER